MGRQMFSKKNLRRFLAGFFVLLIPAITSALFGGYKYSADVANKNSDKIIPLGSIGKGSNTLTKEGANYVFSFISENNKETKYLVNVADLSTGYLKVKAQVNNQEFYPISEAAPFFRLNDPNTVKSIDQVATSSLVSHKINKNSKYLELVYKDLINGTNPIVERQRAMRIFGAGRSLRIEISSASQGELADANYNYAGFSLGNISAENKSVTRNIIPYMPNVPIISVNNRAFYGGYIDITKSNGTAYQKQADENEFVRNFQTLPVQYDLISANKVLPLQETAYITVSNNVNDIFPLPVNKLANKAAEETAVSRIFIQENAMESRVAPEDTPGSNDLFKSDRLAYCNEQPADGEALDITKIVDIEGVNFNKYRFNNVKAYLSVLGLLGIKDITYLGYRSGADDYPRQLPICERWGGEAQYKEIFDTAGNNGQQYIDHQVWHRISEDYLSPTSEPNFSDAVALNRNGRKIQYNTDPSSGEGIERTNYSTSAEGLKLLTATYLSDLKTNFGLSGTFLDTVTGWYPGQIRKINFGNNSVSNSLSKSISRIKEYFTYLNSELAGPIVGEGGKGYKRFDSFYAGYIDGVEREADSHKETAIIPDYELRYIKPRSNQNIGMGWHERWQCQGDFSNPIDGYAPDPQLCVYDQNGKPTGMSKYDTFDFDRYRAQVLSFGHAHLLPYLMNLNPKKQDEMNKHIRNVAKEYYLVSALQKQYLNSKVKTIDYHDEQGQKIGTLSKVMISMPDYDFKSSNLRLEYENGLVIFINNGPANSPNWTVEYQSRNFVLPANGFLAYNPNLSGYNNSGNFLAFSALIDNNRSDYVSSDSYLMSDGRGTTLNFDGKSYSSFLRVSGPKISLLCKPDGTLACKVR